MEEHAAWDAERQRDKWVAHWGRAWGLPGLEARVEISYSPRLRTMLGRALPARGIVRLHPDLATAPVKRLCEVLCHEVAHIAVFELHGGACRPHGPEWAELVRAAGYEPSARFCSRDARSVDGARPRIRHQYAHVCTVCHAQRLSRRPVPQWRCAACVQAGLEGRMEIRRLQPDGPA